MDSFCQFQRPRQSKSHPIIRYDAAAFWLLGKTLVKNLVAIMAALALAACNRSAEPGKAAEAGKSIAVANAGFEQIAGDGSIPGWNTLQHAGPPSYEMVIDTQGAYAGKGSFRITRTRDQVYGSIKQDVAVGSAVGEWIELSAMVKTKDVGPGGWKLMILGAKADEFSPAITGTSDWQRAKVRVQLPNGVATIAVGATLLDAGSGWLDDVQLHAVAP
jgi:hypothetical protein